MMSTRRGCEERPYLAAVLVFTLKVKHLALSRSQYFKDKFPKDYLQIIDEGQLVSSVV